MAAVDMALYDIKGNALGVPVYEILGGLYRDKLETTGLIHLHDVEEDVASAIRLVERWQGPALRAIEEQSRKEHA